MPTIYDILRNSTRNTSSWPPTPHTTMPTIYATQRISTRNTSSLRKLWHPSPPYSPQTMHTQFPLYSPQTMRLSPRLTFAALHPQQLFRRDVVWLPVHEEHVAGQERLTRRLRKPTECGDERRSREWCDGRVRYEYTCRCSASKCSERKGLVVDGLVALRPNGHGRHHEKRAAEKRKRTTRATERDVRYIYIYK